MIEQLGKTPGSGQSRRTSKWTAFHEIANFEIQRYKMQNTKPVGCMGRMPKPPPDPKNYLRKGTGKPAVPPVEARLRRKVADAIIEKEELLFRPKPDKSFKKILKFSKFDG